MNNILNAFQVAPVQRRLITLREAGQEGMGHVACIEMETGTDAARLRLALEQVIISHDIFQTEFREYGYSEFACQCIKEERSAEVVMVPVNSAGEEAGQQAIAAQYAAVQQLLNDAAANVLVRVLCDNKNRVTLIIGLAALAGDVYTIKNIISEAITVYNNAGMAAEEPVQFIQFSEWHNSLLTEGDEEAAAYWNTHYLPEAINKKLPFQSKNIQPASGPALAVKNTGAVLAKQLQQYAAENNTDAGTLLLACWALLLHRQTGTQEITIGKNEHCRSYEAFEAINGPVAQTLPLTVQVKNGDTLTEFLAQVAATLEEARQWQDNFMMDEAAELLQGRYNFFTTGFQYETVSDWAAGQQPAYRVSRVYSHSDRHIIRLLAVQEENDCRLSCYYEPQNLSAAAATLLLDNFTALLERLVGTPVTGDVAAFCALLPAERTTLLEEYSRGTANRPAGKLLLESFEEKVNHFPGATAVACGGVELSYRALNEQANQLAHYLVNKCGVRSGNRVAVQLPRSANLVVAMLGILKTGCSFIPVDTKTPDARLQLVLQNSNAVALICDNFGAHGNNDCPVVVLSAIEAPLKEQPVTTPPVNITAATTCYTIYTSGSTGIPKGVDTTHGNLANYLDWFVAAYAVSPQDSTLVLSSVAFDLTYTSLWSALYAGAALHLLPGDDWVDPVALLQLLQTGKITYIKLTPAHLQLIVNSNGFETVAALLSLRLIVIGGEAINPADIAKYLRYAPACKMVNHYGPTETTIGTIIKNIDAGSVENFAGLPVIGRPIANMRAYILDEQLNPVPAGMAGELCIAGAGVSKGYVGNETLTAEKFATHPFMPCEKIYRTGDLARWVPGGDIEFIGRKDFQVKIRGYRVEPGDVEQALKAVEGIEQALVTAATLHNSTQLVAYYTGRKLEDAVIIRELENGLPAYMIPSMMLHLKEFPLTPNGKIDRKQLPHPENWASAAGEMLLPATPREAAFAKVWGDVLKYTPVSMLDNFFSRGGDSIKAILMVSRLGMEGYSVSVFDVFKYANIKELAAQATVAMVNNKEQEQTKLLSPAQAQFLQHYTGNRNHFNQSVMLKGEFDAGTVQQALTTIVQRHDAFRLVFRTEAQGWIQQYREDDFPLLVEAIDLRNENNPVATLASHANRLQASLDISKGPLLKAAVYHLPDGDRLLIAIHHLVIDGVSWRILLDELELLLAQPGDDQTMLPPPTDTYLHWVSCLHKYAATTAVTSQLDYWKTLEQPAAQATMFDAVNKGVTGREAVSFSLPATITSELLASAMDTYGANPLQVLLTAFSQTCAQAGWNRIMIAMEGHGREQIMPELDITRTIGWFTSIYPVLLENDTPQAQQLQRIKNILGNIPGKGMGYGLLQYINGASLNLPAQISFNYLGQFDSSDSAHKIFEIAAEDRGRESEPHAARYALQVTAMISNGRLFVELDADIAYFSSETLARLLQDYRLFLLQFTGNTLPNEMTNDYTIKELTGEAYREFYKKYDVEDICPLSPLQQGLFFHWRHGEGEDAYYRQFSYRVHGRLDAQLVKKAFDRIMARYDILRAVFDDEVCGMPVQVILKQRNTGFAYADLSADSNKEQTILALRMQDKQKGFQLDKDVLMRIAVYKLDEQLYELSWSYHHIVMDGWSSSVIAGEFFELYESLLAQKECVLPGVGQYRDYIRWIQQQDEKEAIGNWKKYLSGYDEVASLPVKKDSATAAYDPARVVVTLPAATTAQLVQYAATGHFTMNALIQVAWGILLGRYTMRNDIVFGSVVSGRPAAIPGIEKMVGLFINTVPVRIRMDAETVIPQLCREVQLDNMRLQPYHHAQLAEIQSAAGFEKEIFDHFIGFENFPAGTQELPGEEKLVIEQVANQEQTTFGLYITVVPGEQLEIIFSYNRSVYAEAFINDTANRLQHIIAQCIAQPAVKISDIELLTTAEITGFLQPAGKIIPMAEDLIQQIHNSSTAAPAQTALLFNGQAVSYETCNDLAGRLAQRLLQQGVQPGSVVAVWMRRSEWAVIAMLGILKAGAAFLPVDLSVPGQRVRYMLEDAGATTVLTDSHSMFRVMEDFSGAIMALDIELPELEPLSIKLPVTGMEQPAYILYTSGSTGKPKGVVVTRANISYYLSWANGYYFNNKSGYPFVLFTSLSFDLTLTSIFTTLMRGDTVHIFDEEDVHVPLKKIFDAGSGIRAVKLTPSHISILPHLGITATAITHAIVGGEQLTPEQVAILHTLNPSMRVFNEYGPTEITVGCSIAEIPVGAEQVSIGKPIEGAVMYLFNQFGKLQPAGIPGEIFIGGPGVAKGYLNLPALDAQRFVTDPYTGKRLYRTGDKAQWLPGGDALYMGRIDEQVKIRGYRIEPGEIAQVIGSCTGVSNCVVLVQQNGQQAVALIAFVVAGTNDLENIQRETAAQLPVYMVPSYFVPVTEIPVNANGKADKKALLEQFNAFNSGSGDTYMAPATPVQQKLAAIWKEVLEKERIGIRDNFFRLGGHSLKVVMIISRVQRELGVKLDMRLFFDHPTIEAVAEAIGRLQGNNGAQDIPVVPEAAQYEASPAQKRLWIINQLEKNNTAYNITGPLLIEGKLNKPALLRAFRRLLERQESLRTTFVMDNDELVQIIHPAATCSFSVEQADLSGETNPSQKAQELVQEEMNTPFHLEQGPLFRARLLQLGDEQHLLVLSMHHIISDGWSVDVLLNELSAAYTAYVNGMEDTLPVLTVQYKDYAAWQNRQLQGDALQAHQQYWHTQLSGELPVLELPADHSLPQVQTFNGHTIHAPFSAELVQALKQVAEQKQCSVYMLLLSFVKALLWRYTGQRDMIIGMPVSGRSEGSLEHLVGFFVNTLPLRTRFEAGDTFDTLLDKIKNNVLDALAHQVYPFDRLVEDLNVKRTPGRSPVFDVVVALQHTGLVSGSLPAADGLTLKAFEAPGHIAKYHLLFNFVDNGSGIALDVQYNTDLFTEERIRRMIVHLQQLAVSVLDNPLPVQQINYMDAQELELVTSRFTHIRSVTPVSNSITGLFEQAAAVFPDAVAVVHNDTILTYRGLNEEASRLAAYLAGEKNVQPGDRIAMKISRSEKMIIAIMAVLKTGAIYVPLDTENPLQRDLYILNDTAPSLLLADSEVPGEIKEKLEVCYWYDLLAKAPYTVFTGNNTPATPAYVMYTSGSTGNPKGVLVTHKAVVRLVTGTTIPPTGVGERSLLVSSYSFDGSVYSIFNTLLNGGALYVPGKETILSVHALTGYIREHGITEMFVPTALFNMIVENEPQIGRYMQRILSGGEEASPDQFAKCLEQASPGFRLYNVYGPTENTVFSTIWKVVPGAMQAPIGKPIDNTSVYILDEWLQPVPVGIDGELYTGGNGLSEGYLNLPEVTAEKFIIHNGNRLYKTGDLVRWTNDGNILFRGRKDQQAKVNGYRVEPGEVEAVLRRHPLVENVAVAIRGATGAKQLVAWVTLHNSENLAAIRTYLQENLPSYMVPSAMLTVPEIPLNINGKTDFSRLPAVDAQPGDAAVLPETETEQKIAAIWNEVLMRQSTGIHEDFFDIGGHSLKATQIIGRIAKQMAVHIDLRTFFGNPTIQLLARCIDELKEKQFYNDIGRDGEEVEEFIF